MQSPDTQDSGNTDGGTADGGLDVPLDCAVAQNRLPPTAIERNEEVIRQLARSRVGTARNDTPQETSHTRYVSAADGSDDADGSRATPWRTLQHAADMVEPDTTVLVDGSGPYAPVEFHRGGTSSAFVVFSAQDRQSRPVIMGDPGAESLVLIGASYFVLQGFEIAHHQRADLTEDTVGIRIEDEANDLQFIEVRNNLIHDIGPPGLDDDSCYYNGHGIIARAQGTSIRNLTIAGNELHDLYVGHSEVLVVNGNVSGFCIASNFVHDVNNIAIDVIGYELDSRETARDGLVIDNVVLDASNYWPYCSRGNCAYPRSDESSDGIYVDGGAHLEIAYNIVGRADHGIELQSENGQLIRDVQVHHNLLFNNNYRQLTLGEVEDSREFDNVLIDDEDLRDQELERCK